jgi:hypothetical protein
MNASELQQLIEQGEGQQLEFKRSLAEWEGETLPGGLMVHNA